MYPQRACKRPRVHGLEFCRQGLLQLSVHRPRFAWPFFFVDQVWDEDLGFRTYSLTVKSLRVVKIMGAGFMVAVDPSDRDCVEDESMVLCTFVVYTLLLQAFRAASSSARDPWIRRCHSHSPSLAAFGCRTFNVAG